MESGGDPIKIATRSAYMATSTVSTPDNDSEVPTKDSTSDEGMARLSRLETELCHLLSASHFTS